MSASFVRTGRTGVLTLGSLKIQTPALVIPTRTLTVPHLTGDVLKRALSPSRFIIEAYAEDLLENPKLAQQWPFGIKKLADWNSFAVFLATRQYKSQNLGPIPDFTTTKKKEDKEQREVLVLGENKTGRITMKVDDLKDLVARFQPDLFIVPTGFDAFPGPLNEKMQKRCLENTKLIQSYFSQIPTPISINSRIIPEEKYENVLVSFDQVSEKINLDNSANYVRKRLDWDGFLEALNDEKIDLYNAGLAIDLAEASKAIMTDSDAPYLLDLKDVKYQDDDSVLQAGCQCVSCTEEGMGFMKGAIHHYIVVEEMLAPVLLVCHNLHQMERILHKLHCIQ